MEFVDLMKKALNVNISSVPEIRDWICENHPEEYNNRNAVLTRILYFARSRDDFILHDETTPKSISRDINEVDTTSENFNNNIGLIYVLSTKTYTANGDEIIKIGLTTQKIENRIQQLYTTGTPYQFELIKTYEVENYFELEKSLHNLLKPFRLNNSREFFSGKILKYIDNIVNLHLTILKEQKNEQNTGILQ